MLEADGIEYEIKGRKILSNIYLKAEKGEVTGLVGSNGCGKSTLISIIFGSLKAEYSSVRIDGKKLTKGLHPQQIQYLPQFPIFPKSISVEKSFELYSLDPQSFVQYFKNVKVDSKKKFGDLSKGMQRLIKCFIFLKNPCEVTLLDEPFSFVMPVHIEKIKQLIIEEKHKKTIVITDHMFRHIESICDKIYLIKNARTIPIENSEDLIQHGYLPESFFE